MCVNKQYTSAERRLIRFAAEDDFPFRDEEPPAPSPQPARPESVQPMTDHMSTEFMDLIRAMTDGEPTEDDTVTGHADEQTSAADKPPVNVSNPPAVPIPGDIDEMFSSIAEACTVLRLHLEELERNFHDGLASKPLPADPDAFLSLAKESAALSSKIVEEVKSLSEQAEELRTTFGKIMDMLRYAPDVASRPEKQGEITESRKFVQSFVGSGTFAASSVITFQALSSLAKWTMELHPDGFAGFLLMCAVTTTWFTTSAIVGGKCTELYGKIRQALMKHTGHASEALDSARTILAEKFRDARETLRTLVVQAEALCREVNLYNEDMPTEYADRRMQHAESQGNGADPETALSKVKELLRTQRKNINLGHVMQIFLTDINLRVSRLEQQSVNGATEEDLYSLGFRDCEHFCNWLQHDVSRYCSPSKEAPGNVVTNSAWGIAAGGTSVLGKFLRLLSHIGEHPRKTIHDIIKGFFGMGALGWGNSAPSQGNVAFELMKVVGAVDTLREHGFKSLARWLVEVAGNMAIMMAKPTPLIQEAVKRLSQTLTPDQLREEIGTRREGAELLKHGAKQYGNLAGQSLFASVPVITKSGMEKVIDMTNDYMPIIDRLGMGRKLIRWDLDRQQAAAQKGRARLLAQNGEVLRDYAALPANILEVTIRTEWAKYTITHENENDQKTLDHFTVLCDFWEQVRLTEHLEKEIRTREHRKELTEIDDYLSTVHTTAQSATPQSWWGRWNEWQLGKAMRYCARRHRIPDYNKKPAVIDAAPGLQRIIIIDAEGKVRALLHEDIGSFYGEQLSAGRKPHILAFADEPRAAIAETLLGIHLKEEQRQALQRAASDVQSSPEARIRALCAEFSAGQLLGATGDHSFPGLIRAGVAGTIELTDDLTTLVRTLCKGKNGNANGNGKKTPH